MKTAISLPDEIFERATQRANDLGLSRSEFFARAADKYIHDLDASSTTKQIDSVLAEMNDEDASSTAAVAVGRQLLSKGTEEW